MRNVPALLRRELNAYFASVLGYVVLIAFLFIMGRTFSQIVMFLSQRPTQFNAMEALFGMFWFPSLFIIPAITMRLLAEEKRAGTLEMLMTAPVTDFEVVFAKWLGAVLLYVLMWGLTALYVVILHRFSGGATQLDFGPIVSGYICILVIGQFFIALGLLASSLTKNQIIAALISAGVMFVFIIVTLWQSEMETGKAAAVFRYVSPFEHVRDFSRGVLDVRPIVLYLSGTVLALFITTRVVESRKWR